MVGLPRQYIRYEDGTIEQVTDVGRYAEWFNDPKNRMIVKTAVPYGDFKKAVVVSTVFLGFEQGRRNGKPLLWETLAELPGDLGEFMLRYVGEDEARIGHEKIVLEVQARLNVTEAEVDELVADVMGLPIPRPRKIEDPKRKLPDPDCKRCDGRGWAPGALLPDTACDCTFVLRKKNARD